MKESPIYQQISALLGSKMKIKVLLTVVAIGLSAMGSRAAITTWSLTPPTVDGDDIAQLTFGCEGVDTNNVNLGDDAATYIAYDRPAQGETFTTGNNPNGYVLSAITVKDAQNTGGISLDSGWDAFNGRFEIFVGQTNAGIFSHDHSEIAPLGGEQAASPGYNGNTGPRGGYVTFTLSTPVLLAPNTVYAFSIYTLADQYGGGYFPSDGTNSSVYAGGIAFSEAGGVVTAHPGGDRVFHLDLAQATAPLTATWDGGSGSDNNWSSAANWVSDVGPGFSGTSVIFAGNTRTTPVVDQNYSIASLTFSNNASSFTFNNSGGSTLTLGGNLINNASFGHTLNLPISLSGASTWNGGGQNLQVNGALSGSGGLIWLGAGKLTLGTGANSLGGQFGLMGGTAVIPGGSLTVGGNLTAGYNFAGAPSSGSSTLDISNATVTVGGLLQAGITTTAANSVSGTINVTNSTVNVTSDLLVGFAGSGVGKLVLKSNSVLNVASTVYKWARLGEWDTVNSVIDVNAGATMKLNANTDIHMGLGNNSGTNTINLNGGNITFYSDNATTVGGTGILEMQTGWGQCTNTFNLNAGTLTVPSIISWNSFGTRIFNFNGGTLKSAANGIMNIGTDSKAVVNVLAGGAIIDTAGYNLDIQQPLKHGTAGTDGGLTKQGAGQLTLSGSNTFNGPITVSAGALLLTPAHQGTNVVTVANGATFGAVQGSAATVGNVTMGNNTTNKIVLTTGVNPTSPVLNVGALTLNGPTTLQLAGTIQTGSFTVLHCTSHGGGGSFNPTVVGPQGFAGTVAWVGNDLVVNVTSAGGLVWDGSNLYWSTSTVDWTLNGAPGYIYQETTPPGDAVTFDDSANIPSVFVSQVVNPASVVISNSSQDYTFYGNGGHISGSTSVTKLGSGLAQMGASTPSDVNDYTGNTVISEGTLQLGIADAIPGGDGKGNLVVNGTLDLNAFDGTYNNLSGSGTIANTGAGVARFFAHNTVDSTFSGSISGGPAGAGNGLSLHNQLPGGNPNATLTLNLQGTNYLQNMLIEVSKLKLTGGTVIADTGGGSTRVIDSCSLEVSGGAKLHINSAADAEAYFWISGYSNSTLRVDGGTVTVSNNWGTSVGRWSGVGILTIANGGLFINHDQTNYGLVIGDIQAVSGTVNLDGGTLQVNKIISIAGTDAFNFNGGTLKPTVSSSSFWTNNNVGTLTANVLAGGAVIDTDGKNITITQPLIDGGGNGGLTKTGSGVLTLGGANTYKGNTTIQQGSVMLTQNTPVLAATSTLSIASGAAINLVDPGVTNKVASLVTNGVALANGIYSSANLSPFLSGSGYLLVGPSGPTGPAYITNSLSGSSLTLTWPAGEGWLLQAATNLSNPSWVYVTDGSVSSTNITVDPTKQSVFFRLTYP